MSSNVRSQSRGSRRLACCGAVLAASAVALSAYAAHRTNPSVQASLQSAALFAFGHGIALAALAAQTSRTIGRVALLMLLIGTLLFSGTLAAAHFFGVPTRLAPAGGILMIGGWLLYAVAASRR